MALWKLFTKFFSNKFSAKPTWFYLYTVFEIVYCHDSYNFLRYILNSWVLLHNFLLSEGENVTPAFYLSAMELYFHSVLYLYYYF